MHELIELALDTPDGIADCRLEPQEHDGAVVYNATILYPHIVNGFSRSEIFCYDLVQRGSAYCFDENQELHPKIRKLEPQLVAAIKAALP